MARDDFAYIPIRVEMAKIIDEWIKVNGAAYGIFSRIDFARYAIREMMFSLEILKRIEPKK